MGGSYSSTATSQAGSREEEASYYANEHVDLRNFGLCFPYPDATNQGDRVSCVAEAFAMALYCSKVKRGLPVLPRSGDGYPQTLSIYEDALKLSDDPNRGTSFRDVVDEMMRRYGPDMDLLRCRPIYLHNDIPSIKAALRKGIPVVVGYQVNDQIDAFHDDVRECETYGYLLPPFSKNPRSISAHCVLLIGFDDSVLSFIARNSWGKGWGVDGHFLIRYRDVKDTDFFTDIMILDCP
jgi:hypothetical protein